MNQDFNNALDFDEKNCFEKIKTCWKTRSQRTIYLANLHQKTSKLAFFVQSQKSCSGKSYFFPSKKVLWIKTFENNQFLNRLLYNASHFDSRNSSASELDPFCHNSTDFESKVLERLSFRKKVSQRNRFWNEIDLKKKTDFDESFSLRKFFLDRFTPKNANFCSYAFYQKPTIVLRKGKKNSFPIKIFEKIRFWNQFSTTSEIRIKFFKIEQFFGELYTTRLFLYQKFYSASDFETSYLPHIRFWTEISTA